MITSAWIDTPASPLYEKCGALLPFDQVKVSVVEMTVRELAEHFSCDIHTITNHANRLFPGKIRNSQTTLKGSLQGVETVLTPVLIGRRA